MSDDSVTEGDLRAECQNATPPESSNADTPTRSPDLYGYICTGEKLRAVGADRYLPSTVEGDIQGIALSLMQLAVRGDWTEIERILAPLLAAQSRSLPRIWDASLRLYQQAMEKAGISEADASLPMPESETAQWPSPSHVAAFFLSPHNSLVLRWENDQGVAVIAKTNGVLAYRHREDARWLPRGWKMDVFPCGWSQRHLEAWFDYAIAAAKEDDCRGDIKRDEQNRPASNESPRYYPLGRDSLHHVDLIVKHLRIAEPLPLDMRKPVDRLQDLKTFVLARVEDVDEITRFRTSLSADLFSRDLPLVALRSLRRVALPELSDDREAQSRYCQGFDPRWWMPATECSSWKTLLYPREASTEAVRQWKTAIDRLRTEDLGPFNDPESAAQLKAQSDSDLELIRRVRPDLLPPAAPNPETAAVVPMLNKMPDMLGNLIDWFGERVRWFRGWFHLPDAPLPQEYVLELAKTFPERFEGQDRQTPAKQAQMTYLRVLVCSMRAKLDALGLCDYPLWSCDFEIPDFFEAADLHLSEMLQFLRKQAKTSPPKKGGSRKKSGRPPLAKTNPKKLAVYELIRQERKAGVKPSDILPGLNGKKDFLDLVRDAGVKLNKNLVRAALAQSSSPQKKQETPTT